MNKKIKLNSDKIEYTGTGFKIVVKDEAEFLKKVDEL